MIYKEKRVMTQNKRPLVSQKEISGFFTAYEEGEWGTSLIFAEKYV